MCIAEPVSEKLSAYASGRCGRSAESRQMVTRATSYSQRHRITDAQFLYVEKNGEQLVTKRSSAKETARNE
jgi:hypothetical protein